MTDMLTHPVAAVPSGTPEAHRVGEVDGHLTCTGIVDITHDVKSFDLELPDSASLHFLPGQHLTLRFLIDGEQMERCYTISSAPTRPERLTITVKRVPGGVVSNWLHDRLRIGDAIAASGPHGVFSHALHPAAKLLFLTAGSGITPAMSMLRTMRDAAVARDVVFVHCARTPDDIVFRGELDRLASERGLRVVVLCETDSASESWGGPRGRMTEAALLEAAPDVLDREVFTCGPPPYMTAVRELLRSRGANPERTHEESFVLAGQGVGGTSGVRASGGGAGGSTADAETPAGATYRIAFRRSGQVVECSAATTILEAAADAGIVLASSCGEGMCGTCKLTKLSGEVDMDHAGGIRPREVAQGRILACCAKPTDDVVVDA